MRQLLHRVLACIVRADIWREKFFVYIKLVVVVHHGLGGFLLHGDSRSSSRQSVGAVDAFAGRPAADSSLEALAVVLLAL